MVDILCLPSRMNPDQLYHRQELLREIPCSRWGQAREIVPVQQYPILLK